MILAVVLTAGVTACGTPAPQSQPQSQSSPAPTSAADKQQPTVKAELTVQGKPGLGLLAATNQGSAPITFQGWPKLSFTNLANEPAAIPVEQKLVPGEGPSITLQPGQTAFAGVQLDTEDDANAFAIGSITAEVPGTEPTKVTIIGTDGQNITDISKMKVSEAKVGTMQPATQGVLVFD
ncbi:DUF4232 domain-containing protein [Lentzea alba]